MRRAVISFPLLLLLLASPASAIPTCSTGTLADYLAFGSDGCRFGELTFSNFAGSGAHWPLPLFSQPPVPALPGDISITPSLPYGEGSARLFFALAPGIFLNVSFDVAGAIYGDEFVLASGTALGGAVGVVTVSPPGETFSLHHPANSINPVDVFHQLNFVAPFASQHITYLEQVDLPTQFVGLDITVVTPEPTTLLLWGTGAAGLGLARWLRRRSHKHEHAA